MKFQSIVSETQVLVASHHGRENGICDDIFTKYGCHPFWIVISDKGHAHETQDTVNYYAGKVKGAAFDNEIRKVLTTRSDGTILFTFRSDGWSAQPVKKQNPKIKFI